MKPERISSFFLLLCISSAPLCARTFCVHTGVNYQDNVLTATGPASEADTVFTFIGHISERDATKTQDTSNIPYPPEPPRNDTVVQLLKDTARFDNKRLLISSQNIVQFYISLSNPLIHPPGKYIHLPSSGQFRNEILRI